VRRAGQKKVEVPQTTLDRIRMVVDAIANGRVDRKAIVKATTTSARHVDYALVGAISLALVAERRKALVLTAMGRRLASAPRDSEDERSMLKEAINRSAQIRTFAPDLLGEGEPDKDVLAARIQRVSDLSMETARHRAQMILKWRRRLLHPQLRILRTPAPGGMWRRIEVKNFRSIESASIELAPFTVVVGPNGSGKSNFVDTLVFARDVSIDASAAVSGRGGMSGVRRWRPHKPVDVTIDVRVAKSRDALETSYARHQFRLHSGAGGNWNFSKELIERYDDGNRNACVERTADRVQSSTGPLPLAANDASIMVVARQLREFASTSALRNIRRYRLSPELMREPQLSGEESRLDERGKNIAVAIQSIRKKGHIEKIVEPMSRIVPGLVDVFVGQLDRYLTLRFKQQQAEGDVAEFNATEMSEGALRALGIVVATYQMERDELLIIEEPEISVHIGAAHLLFQILKDASERGAVLITTHSADLLDAARDEEILVCEYAEGSTRIGRLASEQRDVVRRGLFSIPELMRAEPLRIEGVSYDGDAMARELGES
jgi:predicted ATPase